MKRIIISKCSGQFGNQLWMFANVIAFALEHEHEVRAPSFHKYAKLFQYWNRSRNITVPAQNSKPGNYSLWRQADYFLNRLQFILNTFLNINLERINLISKIPVKGKKGNTENLRSYTRCYFDKPEYHWLVEKILSRNTVMFQGFMFCSGIEQMKKNGEVLRSIFLPQPSVVNKMIALTRQRPPDAFLVGVHIRRGDYKIYRGGKYHYSNEVYKKIMRHVITLFPYSKVQFFICSDEEINIDEFKEFQFVHYENNSGIEDMYMLSVCQYIMGAPSTFSKWSSYYGNVPLYTIEDENTFPTQTDFEVKFNHYY